MKCREMAREMEAYLDGALTGERKTEFDGHVEQCPACRKDLARRRLLGKMLSGSLQRTAGGLQPPPRILRQALCIVESDSVRPARPLVYWPKWAAAAILPLLALALFFVFVRKKGGKAPADDLTGLARASCIQLVVTHFTGPSPQDWTVKRTYVKAANGEAGSLTLELTRTL